MKHNDHAHRADFSVRCACGMVYNTSVAHVGRKLQCKCGRTVTIVRPDKAPDESHATKSRKVAADTPAQSRSGRWRRTSGLSPLRMAVDRSVRPLRRWALSAVVWAWNLIRSSWTPTQSRRPLRRWTARLVWAWCVGVVVTWLLLISTSESFLPMTLLAYGPRFVLLAPFIPLGIAAAFTARKTLFPLAIALVVVLGPIMGGRVSWRTIGRGIPVVKPVGVVRVMTYNTAGGILVASRLRAAVAQLQPDLITLQECGDVLWDSLRVLPKYHTSRHGGLCTGSRWPITSGDSMPRSDFARIAATNNGRVGFAHRLMLSTSYGPLVLVNVHLETARKGLQALFGQDGLVPDELNLTSAKSMLQRGDAMNRIDINAQIRERESERASVWSAQGDQRVPLLIAGDFNLPVESTIFRRHWGTFTDAFEAVGTGMGWSKREGRLLRIRIDHVLGNAAAPIPVGVWIGPDLGSDHLPVVADLAWPKQ